MEANRDFHQPINTRNANCRHHREKISPYCARSGLIDIDYGLWQGLTPEEARAQWPELVANWYAHPEMVEIPGSETLLQVRDRAMSALQEIFWLRPEQEIVLVSHTVVNRLILLGILGLGIERFWHLRQEPCANNIIEKSEDDFTLVSMNDTCHLI